MTLRLAGHRQEWRSAGFLGCQRRENCALSQPILKIPVEGNETENRLRAGAE